MNTIALLMAGGKSERMRAGGDPTHKALRRVGGLSLLERSLRAIIGAGFHELVVAVAAGEDELERNVNDQAQTLAKTNTAATVTILREQQPLGNIGAVGMFADRNADVLVVYVDNLSLIDLPAIVAFHRHGSFAATFATHEELLVDPYGELELENDEIVAYNEKPTRTIRISSGTCVVASRACRQTPTDKPTGASDLFKLLRAQGERIGAFDHRTPWVDVNDEQSIIRANRVIASNFERFAQRIGR